MLGQPDQDPLFEMKEQRDALMDVRRHNIGAAKASIRLVRDIELLLGLPPAHFTTEPNDGAAPQGSAPAKATSPTLKEDS